MYIKGTMKKKIKVSTIVTTSIVCTVAIASGLILGIYFGKNMSEPKTNYEGFHIDNYEDDNDALYQRFLANQAVDAYKPYELVNIAIEKFARNEHTKTVTHGQVDAAIVKQMIYAEDVRDGNEYYTESLSYSSIVKCGVRFYQHEDSIDEYTATKVEKDGSATFSERNKATVSYQEHEDNWGKTLNRPVIFIISSKTVLDCATFKTDTGYDITLSLDPTLSVLRYVKQMKSISDLKRYPEFNSVNVTFSLDKDLNLVQMKTVEDYVVYVVGKNESIGTLTVDYYHDVSDKIPSLKENYPY